MRLMKRSRRFSEEQNHGNLSSVIAFGQDRNTSLQLKFEILTEAMELGLPVAVGPLYTERQASMIPSMS